MARLILKCPYFKGGSKRVSAHLGNLVNYIATRDGVEKIQVKDIDNLSSEKQNQLINQIIKEFPNTKKIFEYEDYIKNPTIKNASEFISIAIEENFDKIGKRKNYVDYIANRPGTERIGKPMEDWIKELKDHMVYIHFHSNNGRYDEHRRPTDNEIEELKSLLDKYKLEPVISLEYRKINLKEEIERFRR